MIYGYCRISTSKQSIERQIRNIKRAYSNAVIVKETYTGTKTQERKELVKIISTVKAGDTIVFDSVSRMSRNSEEGFDLYENLYGRNIDLVFLKEPHINTAVYRRTLQNQIRMTGTNADIILEAVNRYLMILAKEQIKIAFDQSEKEVQDLHQRTREGIETARLNGKQIGQKTGAHLVTHKSVLAKEKIQKYSRDFEGNLSDPDVIRLIGIARGTYYKYKKELKDDTTKLTCEEP